MEIEIREFAYGSAEYELAVALRTKVLRKPLGLAFSAEDLARDSGEIHLGAFLGGGLVGCLTLAPQAAATAKMRQVAVDPGTQGSGVGRKLVEACEARARELGLTEVILNSREVAVPFYFKLGYGLEGDSFMEVGIPHRRMRKLLR